MDIAFAMVRAMFSAGNFIMSCSKYCHAVSIETLSGKIDKLVDKELYTALSFVQNASDCKSETEARNNVSEAYKHFVSAVTMYDKPSYLYVIHTLIEGTIREGANEFLGDNLISRRVTGVSKFRRINQQEELIIEKLKSANLGVAVCAYLKGETKIASKYLDKSLFDKVYLLKTLYSLVSDRLDFVPKIKEIHISLREYVGKYLDYNDVNDIINLDVISKLEIQSMPNLAYIKETYRKLKLLC